MQPTQRTRSPVAGVLLLGLGIALSWVAIGVPLMALGTGLLLAWAHATAVGREADKRALVGGWAAMVILGAAVITGGVFGVSSIDLVGEGFADDTALVITAVLAPLVAGLVFAPLAFVPSLALHAAPTGWVAESVWLSAQRGALGTALLGLGLGAHAALPIAGAWLCGELVDDDLAPLALLAGGGLTILTAPFSLRFLAGAYGHAKERAADAPRAERALGALGRFSLLPLAVLGVVLAICALTPSPLRETPGATPTGQLPLTLPGTAVTIEGADWRGVTVTGPSGGITRYPVAGSLWSPAVDARAITVDGDAAWYVEIAQDGQAYTLVLDDSGRRLDDSIVTRITSRFPSAALPLLAIACVLALRFTWLARRTRSRVRTLAHVIGATSHDVIAGTLALRSATPRVVSGQLIDGGGAAIESEAGALRIALPDRPVEVLAIAPDVERVGEGTPIVLVSRGARLGGVGMRDASAPFPPGGTLVLGDPARAAAALVRSAVPHLVRLGLAIGGFLVAATIAIAAATQ